MDSECYLHPICSRFEPGHPLVMKIKEGSKCSAGVFEVQCLQLWESFYAVAGNKRLSNRQSYSKILVMGFMSYRKCWPPNLFAGQFIMPEAPHLRTNIGNHGVSVTDTYYKILCGSFHQIWLHLQHASKFKFSHHMFNWKAVKWLLCFSSVPLFQVMTKTLGRAVALFEE